MTGELYRSLCRRISRIYDGGGADMCGRYYRRSDKQRIAAAFGVGVPPSFDILPSWNVAPQSFQPVIRRSGDSADREVVQMRWGMIPFWAKDARIGSRTINAKSETVAASPAFREAARRRRCLVPADGFYEWQREAGGAPQPYAIARRDTAPMALAGLWDCWRNPESKQLLETFTVLTTEANRLMAPIHSRMPVILAPEDYERWLSPGEGQGTPFGLPRLLDADLLRIWKVSPAVGNVRNDWPELCAEWG